jgi:hypothetical protein
MSARLNKELIKLGQEHLKRLLLYEGAIDGIQGPKTNTAVQGYVFDGGGGWENPNRGSAMLALAQSELKVKGFNPGRIDGILGPKTNAALQSYLASLVQPTFNPSANSPFPKDSTAALVAYYGNAGTNQTLCQWAYPLTYFGKPVRDARFSCNIKVKNSLERISQRVLEAYGISEIERLGLNKWAGCLNVRPITNGRRLSTHAWGIAVDWDSQNNQFSWNRPRATLSHKDCVKWWEIWESEGWVSLGRARDYDWMHVQAAVL